MKCLLSKSIYLPCPNSTTTLLLNTILNTRICNFNPQHNPTFGTSCLGPDVTGGENPNLNYNSKKYFIKNNCKESLCFHNGHRSLQLDKRQAYASVTQKNKTCKTGQKLDHIVKVVMAVALWRLSYLLQGKAGRNITETEPQNNLNYLISSDPGTAVPRKN